MRGAGSGSGFSLFPLATPLTHQHKPPQSQCRCSGFRVDLRGGCGSKRIDASESRVNANKFEEIQSGAARCGIEGSRP